MSKQETLKYSKSKKEKTVTRSLKKIRQNAKIDSIKDPRKIKTLK